MENLLPEDKALLEETGKATQNPCIQEIKEEAEIEIAVMQPWQEALKKQGKLTPWEWQHHRANNLYLYSSNLGHIATNCLVSRCPYLGTLVCQLGMTPEGKPLIQSQIEDLNINSVTPFNVIDEMIVNLKPKDKSFWFTLLLHRQRELYMYPIVFLGPLNWARHPFFHLYYHLWAQGCCLFAPHCQCLSHLTPPCSTSSMSFGTTGSSWGTGWYLSLLLPNRPTAHLLTGSNSFLQCILILSGVPLSWPLLSPLPRLSGWCLSISSKSSMVTALCCHSSLLTTFACPTSRGLVSLERVGLSQLAPWLSTPPLLLPCWNLTHPDSWALALCQGIGTPLQRSRQVIDLIQSPSRLLFLPGFLRPLLITQWWPSPPWGLGLLTLPLFWGSNAPLHPLPLSPPFLPLFSPPPPPLVVAPLLPGSCRTGGTGLLSTTSLLAALLSWFMSQMMTLQVWRVSCLCRLRTQAPSPFQP